MSHSGSDLELSPDFTKTDNSPPAEEVPGSGLEQLTLETSHSPPAKEDTGDQLELPPIETSHPLSTGEDALPPLLRLPAELRNRIWMLCVVVDDDTSIWMRGKWFFRNRKPRPSYNYHYRTPNDDTRDDAMSIFRTNRQLHDEASSIFYGMNTFALINYTATPFLSSPKSTYLRHIRSLALSEAAANIVLKYIVRCWPPKLKRVEISVTPRSVPPLSARGLDQCAMDVAKKVVRVVKSERHRGSLNAESPNVESIFECFELCQEPCIFVPNLNGTSVSTDEELDAAFQGKLREILAGDCDLGLSTWWPDVAASMIA